MPDPIPLHASRLLVLPYLKSHDLRILKAIVCFPTVAVHVVPYHHRIIDN